jgi:hypothetical protein
MVASVLATFIQPTNYGLVRFFHGRLERSLVCRLNKCNLRRWFMKLVSYKTGAECAIWVATYDDGVTLVMAPDAETPIIIFPDGNPHTVDFFDETNPYLAALEGVHGMEMGQLTNLEIEKYTKMIDDHDRYDAQA